MQNKGIHFAFIASFISGLAIFFNKFAVSFWQNSSIFTTAKNITATILLISLLVLLKKINELKNLSKKQWSLLVLIGLIGGSIPFLLFFKGLTLTSAANAAFIQKTLFIWIALIAIPFLKEKISSLQFLALGIILTGIYLIKPISTFKLGYGEILILLATLLWAIENILAKIALKNIPTLIIVSGRMFFGSILLLGYLFYSKNLGQLSDFSGMKSLWLILSGIILFGYVMAWYSALKYAPATVVSSILVIAAPITALLDSLFITHKFNNLPILAFALIIFGILFFTPFFNTISKIAKKYLIWQTA